jgi:hypothetical protein
MSFDPKAYLARKTSGAAGFDPKAYLQNRGAAPKEERGMIGNFLEALDTYTGAPARAGIGALWEGKNPISAAATQFGENPELAPTPRELAQKHNLSDKPIFQGDIPVTAADPEGIQALAMMKNLSNEDVGTAAYGVGADLTNLIPVVGQGAKLLKAGATAAKGVKVASTAAKGGEAVADASKVAKATSSGEKIAALTGKKAHAAEIEEAAKLLDAPVLPGQTLKGKLLQNIDSILQNSPTFIGQKQREVADKGIDAVRGRLNEALENKSLFSEADLGKDLKASIASRVMEENKPISELYNSIRESTTNIPLQENSLMAISRNVGKLKQARISPSSSAAGIARRVQHEIPNLKTVDDVKEYRTLLRGELNKASDAERAVISNIDARLKALEEGTVTRVGKKMADDTSDPVFKEQAMKLIGERKSANQQYAQFREKLDRMGKKIGIGDKNGAASFVDRLGGVSDEKIARKLFDKDDSDFLKFMAEEFPDQTKNIFDTEKARILREATKDNVINPNKVLKEVENLSKEAQQLMFSPEQLQKIKAAKVYTESLPANANPSGTAFTQNLLTFSEKPVRATLANARDLALKKFLDSAQKGDGLATTAFTKVGNVAKESGRKAVSGAEKTRKSLRAAAVERVDESPRKKFNRKARIRAIGD